MADQKGLNLSKYTPKLPDSNEYLLGRTTYVYTNLYQLESLLKVNRCGCVIGKGERLGEDTWGQFQPELEGQPIQLVIQPLIN